MTVFLSLLHPYFVFLLIIYEITGIFTKWHGKNKRYPDVVFIDRSKEYRSTAGSRSFHTHFRVQVIPIVEDQTVTVKWRTAIKVQFPS